MSESILRELQQSAVLALKSHSVEEGVLHLSRAFAVFSEETARLKTALAKLQERLDGVNGELGTLHHILRLSSDGFLFLNLEGQIAFANDAARKLLDLKTEEKRFWEVLKDDALGFSMREALKFGISHKLLYKSFGQKELEISTSFLYEGPKPNHGLLVSFRDVSERQRMQQMAARSNRMRELGEMAAAVVHELRNPLGGIRGYASLLTRDLAQEPQLREMAEMIVEGTKSLERVAARILHFARPVQIEARSVEMGLFLKQLVRFVKIDPSSPPDVAWSLHIPDGPLLAPVDPAALKSALLNLIFNAFQAMPHGGTLTLSLMKIDSCYQIAISDTGIGMGEEQMKRLFSPLFTTKEKGNGLGLVEAQKIVQAHHGSIDVRSRLGKGTTFTLTLPLKR